MDGTLNAEKRLVRVGVACGLLAAMAYLIDKLVPLPPSIAQAAFVYSGPLLAVAMIGLFPFLRRPRMTASAILGVVFGVITGLMRMVFTVVQEANVERFGRIVSAQDPATVQMWRDVKGSVFSVQSGCNFVFDFFGDWTGFFFAIAMWHHPKFGKRFSILGVLMIAPHFVMKVVTFPIPPGTAGLFDAGPLAMLFLVVVMLQVVRNLSWMKTWGPAGGSLESQVA